MVKKKGMSRLEEPKQVDLYKEELAETLVEAGTASSGWTEERDADRRAEALDGDKAAKKKKGKK
jgi:hypothetical protein